MWVRKTREEILKTKIKSKTKVSRFFETKLGVFILVVGVLTIGVTILTFFIDLILGGELILGNYEKLSAIELTNRLPKMLWRILPISLIFYVLFIVIFKWDKYIKRKQGVEGLRYVCDKCNKLTDTLETKQCECGGEFVDINKMKWVDS